MGFVKNRLSSGFCHILMLLTPIFGLFIHFPPLKTCYLHFGLWYNS